MAIRHLIRSLRRCSMPALLTVGILSLPHTGSAATRPVPADMARHSAAAQGTSVQRQRAVQRATSVVTMLHGLKLMNYYPAHNGWSAMWTNWDQQTIDNDFARIAALHANAVRVILQAAAFGYPTPRPAIVAHLSQIVALAAAHGLRVQLTLFDWWSSYGDLNGSKLWAHAILAPFVGDPRIAFIELQNEVDPLNATVMAWVRQMLPYLQQQDGGIPVTVSTPGSAGTAALQALATHLASSPPDFYDFHYYPGCSVDAAYATLLKAQRIAGALPLFIGETGFPSSIASVGACNVPPTQPAADAYQDYFLRTVEYAAQALGLPAAAPWTLTDFANGAIPASSTANDATQYLTGLYRVDGTPKPAATTIAALFNTGAIDTSFNNSFELSAGAGATSVPADWRIYHGWQAQFARDTTVSHSGIASVRINRSGGDSTGVPAFYITPVNAHIVPGLTYTASAWVRGQNATGGNRVAIGWFDADGVYLGQTESPWLPVGTTSWIKLTARGTAPTGASYVQIHLKSSANAGSVWFDDVAFGIAYLNLE